jgi:hypothetical protein
VCLCVCYFAYSSRTDKPICTTLGMLIPWDQEEKIGGSKLRKSVLSSISGEGVSCSSETKHNRRTAPRPKFFVWKRRLQKQTLKHRKLSWVQVSVKILGFGIIKKLTIFNPRDDIRHDTYEPTMTAPTIGVAIPTQYTIYSADEPRNATRHEADKPTPSVVTPIVATPTKDSTYRTFQKDVYTG